VMAARIYSDKQRQVAEKRLADGDPATAIARELNLHLHTVVRWRKALGIKPHPWGWPLGRSRKKEGK